MHLAIHVHMMSHGLHLSGVFKAITLIRSEQKYYAQNRRISMEYVIMLSKTGMAWVDKSKSTLLQLKILVDWGAIIFKLNRGEKMPSDKNIRRERYEDTARYLLQRELW